MAIDLSEFKRKIASGEVKAGSELSMRSESKQSKFKMETYQRLERKKNKMSKLLIPTEIALPFNPVTGEEDDTYNAANKFRPVASTRTVAKLVKSYANEVDATKQRLMTMAGLDEWDTSNCEELNDEDLKVFRPYIVPSIFTINTFSTSVPGMTDWDSISYILDVERDEFGKIVGPVPLPVQANRFFAAIAQEEIDAFKKDVKEGKINATADDVKDKEKKIRESVIKVSSDFPTNYVRVVELEINEEYNLKTDLGRITAANFDSYLYQSKLGKEFREAVKNFNGSWKSKNVYWDFLELDMKCPERVELNGMPEAAVIAKDTKYEKVEDTKFIKNDANFDSFLKAYEEYVDSHQDAERTVWATTKTHKYDTGIEEKLIEALEEYIDLDNPFITDKVVKNNKDFIMTVFGEKGDMLVMESDAGVSGRKEGSYDEEEANAGAKEYAMADLLEDTDTPLAVDPATEVTVNQVSMEAPVPAQPTPVQEQPVQPAPTQAQPTPVQEQSAQPTMGAIPGVGMGMPGMPGMQMPGFNS